MWFVQVEVYGIITFYQVVYQNLHTKFVMKVHDLSTSLKNEIMIFMANR